MIYINLYKELNPQISSKAHAFVQGLKKAHLWLLAKTKRPCTAKASFSYFIHCGCVP
jgi:hypothetical protein